MTTMTFRLKTILQVTTEIPQPMEDDEQPQEHVLLDDSQFKKNLLVPWSKRKLEVKKSGKLLAELRKLNKEDEGKIIDWMKHRDIEQIKVPQLGVITVNEKTQASAINKKFLESQLRQTGNLDEKTAADLADAIDKARPTTKKTSLKVGQKRKRGD
jgi:hypothetical protein